MPQENQHAGLAAGNATLRSAKRAEPVEETCVRIELNGRTEVVRCALPERLRDLAAGHLLVAGYIDSSEQLLEIRESPPQHPAAYAALVVEVRVDDQAEARGRAERVHRMQSDDGLAHVLRCPDCRGRLRCGSAPLPPLVRFPALFAELYASASRYREGGGVHSAALSDGEGILHAIEEVARHSAVDKVLGAALLADEPLGRLGLLTTARISGEMAYKAARCGLAWIASRSVPTTLALAIAGEVSMPVVARAPGREPRVYAPPGMQHG